MTPDDDTMRKLTGAATEFGRQRRHAERMGDAKSAAFYRGAGAGLRAAVRAAFGETAYATVTEAMHAPEPRPAKGGTS